MLLLGASGRTGRRLLTRALRAGDEVTALVRTEGQLAELDDPRLRIHIGHATDPAVLTALVPGHDVVVSTLGPRKPTRQACRVYSESARALVTAMAGSGVQRLLVTSSALVSEEGDWLGWLLRRVVPNVVRHAGEMERQIQASDLKWTIARTGFLTDGDGVTYRSAKGAMPPQAGSLARAALAEFLWTEAHRAENVGQVVGLSGP